jgi:hypothetical protein
MVLKRSGRSPRLAAWARHTAAARPTSSGDNGSSGCGVPVRGTRDDVVPWVGSCVVTAGSSHVGTCGGLPLTGRRHVAARETPLARLVAEVADAAAGWCWLCCQMEGAGS